MQKARATRGISRKKTKYIVIHGIMAAVDGCIKYLYKQSTKSIKE